MSRVRKVSETEWVKITESEDVSDVREEISGLKQDLTQLSNLLSAIGINLVCAGTTEDVKRYCSEHSGQFFFFIDYTLGFVGVTLPVTTTPGIYRGYSQIYTAVEGDNTVYKRSRIDGTYFGQWS